MKEAKVPKPNPSALTEKGEGFGLYTNGLIDSQDYNSKLIGSAGVDVYNQMRLGDATVRATLLVIKLPILSARWWVEPASQARKDRQVAEFVEDCIFNDMSRTWQETLQENLLYLDFGRMPFEIVWKFRDDGTIGIDKLASRWPSTIYSWQMSNGKAGITQQTASGRYDIPMEKLIIFVNQKEGNNWEGVSILRSAYKHWFMKDKMYLIDAMAMERHGLGVPYAKKPTGTRDGEEDDMEEMLRNLRVNEKGYIIFPDGWEVGFLDMKSATVKNPIQMIQHHDRQISKNILAQFLELGSGSTGSFALNESQSKLFILSLEAVAAYVRDNWNKYVIKKLVDYNFIVDDYPELQFEKIGNVDVNMLTTAYQRCVQIGAIRPQEEDERYLRDIMDLPEYSGATLADPTMADEVFGDLDTQFDTALNEQPEQEGAPTPEELAQQVEQASEDYKRLPTKEFAEVYGEEVLDVLKAWGGKPVSDETKNKISEALLRYWSTRKKSKTSTSKGKKGKKPSANKDPEYTQARDELKALRREYKDYKQSVQREFLELRAKGQKLSPEDLAKKQLEIFDKKAGFEKRMDELKDKMDEVKARYIPAEPKTPEKPAKAHDHEAEATDPALLKMSEDLENAIKKIS